ncbi:MAG: hypothetical protein JRI39_06860 [Deltaproteobacteria bacterium]|nr:hypothetical protein [Deltaproteobacteria bacterium]MBW2082796.1 hypothetical protein [Deltaproteobacteria bacterium]HDM09897.1 hypothetical protein [Desulfobacteraceae bacterium]
MKNFMKVSPLRLLDMSAEKELGHGNLGVLISRAGVGKTACLVHIAFDRIFSGEALVHVSVEETPDKVASYYNVIFFDLIKALELDREDELRLMIERNRMILSYMKGSFSVDRLRQSLVNLKQNLSFVPQTLIIDGLDFEGAPRQLFEQLKELSAEFGTETWLSALSHRHKTEVNDRGIPYPCHQIDDLFDVIVHLAPSTDGIYLRLLKDRDHPISAGAQVRLDPNTFLVMAE